MTAPTDVDCTAPVIGVHEIDIEAPLETVWRFLTDVNAWPAWQPNIADARIDGAFEPGTSFVWASYGFNVESTIYKLTERSRVLWGGTASGITAVQEWLFSETPSGAHVTVTESCAGAPAEADAPGLQTLLDASLVAWLGHLKVAAEASV